MIKEFCFYSIFSDKHNKSTIAKSPVSSVSVRKKIETDIDSDSSIKSVSSKGTSSISSDLERLKSKYATEIEVPTPSTTKIKKFKNSTSSVASTSNKKPTTKPKTTKTQLKLEVPSVSVRRKIETDNDSDSSIETVSSKDTSSISSDLERLKSKYATEIEDPTSSTTNIKKIKSSTSSVSSTSNTKPTTKPKTTKRQLKLEVPSVSVRRKIKTDSDSDSSIKSVSSKGTSSISSDLERLKSKYATEIEVPTSSMSKQSIPVVTKTKSAAVQNHLMEELIKKCRAATTEPMTQKEKARKQRERRKLLDEQKRSEHEAFLMEAMGVAIIETSTRRSAVTQQIQAMLNKLFAKRGDYIPPMTESFGPVVSREKLRRGVTEK
jgi:hypothetical protein